VSPNLRRVGQDLQAMEKELAASGLDWYALRPIKLTDGPLTGHVRASDRFTMKTISRADVAWYILTFAEDPAPRHQHTPVITSTKPRAARTGNLATQQAFSGERRRKVPRLKAGRVSVPLGVAFNGRPQTLSACCDEDQLAAFGSGGPPVPATKGVLHGEAGAGQRPPPQLHVAYGWARGLRPGRHAATFLEHRLLAEPSLAWGLSGSESGG